MISVHTLEHRGEVIKAYRETRRRTPSFPFFLCSVTKIRPLLQKDRMKNINKYEIKN